MTERLKYMLELGVTNNADVDEIEELLQQLLLDLYEQGEVESIRVTKDDHSASDEEVKRLVQILNELDSNSVRRAIDSVKELEESGSDDNDG